MVKCGGIESSVEKYVGVIMDKKARIKEINSLLDKGENIISYLTDEHNKLTTVEDEMISYDLRAGEDLARYYEDSSLSDKIIDKICHYIRELCCITGKIVECGAGEGINLVGVINKGNFKFSWARGLDISWSRTAYARKFSKNKDTHGIDLDFIVGDFFHLPFKDDSIDILYTMQGIYGMGGYEEELLKELYRVTKGYLILIEPCYELACQQARARMKRLGYVKGLCEKARFLGYEIVKYELFGVDSNPLNPAAALIIKKNVISEKNDSGNALCCPYTHCSMEIVGDAYYCEESKLSYPIINGVACLTRENAVVTSKVHECINGI